MELLRLTPAAIQTLAKLKYGEAAVIDASYALPEREEHIKLLARSKDGVIELAPPVPAKRWTESLLRVGLGVNADLNKLWELVDVDKFRPT